MAEQVPTVSKDEAKKYQHMVLIDASGSMGEDSVIMPNTNRWGEGREHISGLVGFLKDVDPDGIDVIVFATGIKVFRNIKTTAEVKQIFESNGPKGTTNFAGAFREAQKLRAEGGNQPTFIHAFTDGFPDDPKDTKVAIGEIVKTMTKDEDVAINILQIGDDAKANQFLRQLDDTLQDELQLEYDAVNIMDTKEADGLSYEQIMWKALND